MDYMGYKIVAGEACTASIERCDPRGQQEQAAVTGGSQEAAIDAAKKVIRVAVRSKLPLNLALKVAGI